MFVANGFQLLPKLPATVDPKTITMSNSPGSSGDKKNLAEIQKFPIGRIGLR